MNLDILKQRKGKIFEHIEKYQRQDYSDFWSIGNEKGKSSALIRFLPRNPGELELAPDLPFYAKTYRHRFETDDGEWTNIVCSSTWGDFDACPICTENNRMIQEMAGDFESRTTDLFPDLSKEEQRLIRDRSRRMRAYVNVLVVDDATNPANNGTVKIWEITTPIFKIITSKMDDSNPRRPGFDPSCPWEGADLFIEMQKTGKNRVDYPHEWQQRTSLGTDEEIQAIWEQCHELKKYETASENKKPTAAMPDSVDVKGKAEVKPAPKPAPKPTVEPKTAPKAPTPEPTPEVKSESGASDGDEFDMEYLDGLLD